MKAFSLLAAQGRRRWSVGLVALLLAAGLFGAGCATLDQRQRAWIFQPTKDTWWAGPSATQGMVERWIEFDSDVSGEPVKLHALWLPQEKDAKAPVLLYLHGARWNVTGSATRMRRMHELGFAVLGIDYRGFGKSSDALPSEAMAYEDARAAWAWLATQHPKADRYLFGHSLGGAIAVHLATVVDDAARAHRRRQLHVDSRSVLVDELGLAAARRLHHAALRCGVADQQGQGAGAYRARQRRPPDQPGHGPRAVRARAEPKRFVLVEGGSHHNTNAIGQSMYREALHELFGFGNSGT